jgi:hypothetical protein
MIRILYSFFVFFSFVPPTGDRLLGEGALKAFPSVTVSRRPTEDGLPRPSSRPQAIGSLEKEYPRAFPLVTVSASALTEDGLGQ